ncbi:hypothetical protein BREVNS_1647 [Brevinematales bacterium NS]|nr:hypothetical protein BREVNS_1647 [Brevinematales bacterium NS]
MRTSSLEWIYYREKIFFLQFLREMGRKNCRFYAVFYLKQKTGKYGYSLISAKQLIFAETRK